MTSTNVVGIRFQKIGKIYHFSAPQDISLKVGDFVVVDTSRGQQLGEIAALLSAEEAGKDGNLKPILRPASARDMLVRQTWQTKEVEAMVNCRAKLSDLKIEGVKIIAAEYTFDGRRLTVLYSSEGEEQVDLSRLLKSMRQTYTRTRIEFRQIGPRDVAKILGGMGACGMENRCCSRFLTDFSPISIKMAKAQGISLAPSEITGMCGRLRCCLIYEYEQYVEARKTLPKKKKRVITPDGEGRVWDVYPLKQTVIVNLESGGSKEFPVDEIQPWEEWEALRKKAQQPCSQHPEGGCACQAKS